MGKSERGTFGDVVLELDDAVGQVLAKLQALGIDDHTLVVFSSDNGAWRTMRAHGGSNGVLREGKLTTFEGGHRVPALARWPGHIPPGIANHQVVTMMDWFPTFAALAGVDVPADRVIDGKDLSAVLRGTGERESTPFYYFALRPPHATQVHRLAGVREGQWKLKLAQTGYYPPWLEPLIKVGLYHHGDLLFDLAADPGETTNVMAQHPAIAHHLRRLVEDFNRNNPMPEPIRVTALARDATGWEQLWIGIADSGSSGASLPCPAGLAGHASGAMPPAMIDVPWREPYSSCGEARWPESRITPGLLPGMESPRILRGLDMDR